MTGIQMLLKSMGIEINPADIAQGIEGLKQLTTQTAPAFAQRLIEMDHRLQRIETMQLEMMKLWQEVAGGVAASDHWTAGRVAALQSEFDKINKGNNGDAK